MSLKFTFKMMITIRTSMQALVNSMSFSDLIKIPDSFRNNCYWQIGHMTVTTALLTYGRSDQPLPVSQQLVKAFQNGTIPDQSVKEDTFPQISNLLLSSVENLQADYEQGKFSQYNPYRISRKITLTNIEEAVEFCRGHDHYHHGILRCYHQILKSN